MNHKNQEYGFHLSIPQVLVNNYLGSSFDISSEKILIIGLIIGRTSYFLNGEKWESWGYKA
jgi:hypothetical protein